MSREAALGRLLRYAVRERLIGERDVPYALNLVLAVLRLDTIDAAAVAAVADAGRAGVADLLRPLLDDAAGRGVLAPDTPANRDLLDTAIMGALVPPPSAVIGRFWSAYAAHPRAATDEFHRLCVASNYVRTDRTARNVSWRHPTPFGLLDITINASKPEKDPRDIAAERDLPTGGYPACVLCRENEGYAGRPGRPARQNLRLIPLDLLGEDWFLQYSPYEYYPEHCIILSAGHRPMRIDRASVARLLESVTLLPHYFVGSNADLPIVGGSILSHDHFQGGRHEFPMDRAAARSAWLRGAGEVRGEILQWPLSVFRLAGARRAEVLAAADELICAFREHDEPETGLVARTGDTQHSTVTPVARLVAGEYRLDLVLRNNRTTPEHPDGLFHPHAEIHPVKRENIGLIEAMGLAILPGRLLPELAAVADALVAGTAAADLPDGLQRHGAMMAGLSSRAGGPIAAGQAAALVRAAVGDYFAEGLSHCGVFGSGAPQEERFARLLRPLGWVPA